MIFLIQKWIFGPGNCKNLGLVKRLILNNWGKI